MSISDIGKSSRHIPFFSSIIDDLISPSSCCWHGALILLSSSRISTCTLEVSFVVARDICRLCEDANEDMRTLKFVGSKMEELENKIYQLQEEEFPELDSEDALNELGCSLKIMKILVEEASDMDALTYGIKALGINEDLEASLLSVQSSLSTIESWRFQHSLSRGLRDAWKGEARIMKKTSAKIINDIASPKYQESMLYHLMKQKHAASKELPTSGGARNERAEREVAALEHLIASVDSLSFDVR